MEEELKTANEVIDAKNDEISDLKNRIKELEEAIDNISNISYKVK
jgi:predicted  nucleic acid-binding Zn-ribbon protein